MSTVRHNCNQFVHLKYLSSDYKSKFALEICICFSLTGDQLRLLICVTSLVLIISTQNTYPTRFKLLVICKNKSWFWLLQICFFDSFLNFVAFRNHPILNYVLDEKNCNIHLYSTNGTFTSPGYPAKYGNDLNCTAIITVAPEKRVYLRFSLFSLEYSTTCAYDFVQIIDGSSSKKYCGSTSPPAMTSKTNQLIIRFISDGSEIFQGFFATYQTVNRE